MSLGTPKPMHALFYIRDCHVNENRVATDMDQPNTKAKCRCASDGHGTAIGKHKHRRPRVGAARRGR